MTDFKAKMHQIRFRLGLRPRPRWGSLQRSPRPPSWIWGLLLRRGKGKGGEGRRREEREGEGRERKGPWAPHYLEEVYAYGSPLSPLIFSRTIPSPHIFFSKTIPSRQTYSSFVIRVIYILKYSVSQKRKPTWCLIITLTIVDRF